MRVVKEFIPRNCQWINSDGSFCGTPTKINHSWCDYHREQVFERVDDEDDILEEDFVVDDGFVIESIDVYETDLNLYNETENE